MWTEMLKVRPVLDKASAASMEMSLHQRFSRVAKRFGVGLKGIIKGSLFGLSIALISRLLNPLEEIEKRIKDLLGQGEDASEFAARLGASPQELKLLESVAKSLGLPAEKLKEVLTHFDESIKKAREELSDASVPRSASTQALLRTIGEEGIRNTNEVESFKLFSDKLRKEGAGGGEIVPGPLNAFSRTGAETRAQLEKEVLGAAQFGGAKRFIDADLEKQAAVAHLPNKEDFRGALDRLGRANELNNRLEAEQDANAFIRDALKINEESIRGMNRLAEKDAVTLSEKIAGFGERATDAEGIKNIIQRFDSLIGIGERIVGILGRVVGGTDNVNSKPMRLPSIPQHPSGETSINSKLW